MAYDITETGSLTNFTSDPSPFLEKLRSSGEPMLLIQEGQAAVVVQDAASYQRILEKVDQLETIAAVKEGLRDSARGRTWPMREALAELAAKHQLPKVQDS